MSDGGLVGLAEYPSEEEASDAARQLLERGVGCEVGVSATGDGYVVQVLPTDLARARKHLGIAEDAPTVAAATPGPGGSGAEVASGSSSAGGQAGSGGAGSTKSGDEPEKTNEDGEKIHQLLGGRIEATTRQILVAGSIYLAALILIPLLAFYGTRWAVGSGSDDPEPVPITLPE